MSPLRTPDTEAPTSSTMPTPSCPRIRPSVTVGTSPFRMWRSVPQIVDVVIRTIASVASRSSGSRPLLPGTPPGAVVDEGIHRHAWMALRLTRRRGPALLEYEPLRSSCDSPSLESVTDPVTRRRVRLRLGRGFRQREDRASAHHGHRGQCEADQDRSHRTGPGGAVRNQDGTDESQDGGQPGSRVPAGRSGATRTRSWLRRRRRRDGRLRLGREGLERRQPGAIAVASTCTAGRVVPLALDGGQRVALASGFKSE